MKKESWRNDHSTSLQKYNSHTLPLEWGTQLEATEGRRPRGRLQQPRPSLTVAVANTKACLIKL